MEATLQIMEDDVLNIWLYYIIVGIFVLTTSSIIVIYCINKANNHIIYTRIALANIPIEQLLDP
jgi:hypothetical protein